MIPVAAAGAWDEGRPLRREARKKREGALASWTGAPRCRLCRSGPVDELPASRARPLVHGLADHDVEERASVFGRPQLLGKVAVHGQIANSQGRSVPTRLPSTRRVTSAGPPQVKPKACKYL